MRSSDARADLLARVASLYYERDMGQLAIARDLGMSRSNISRLLREARERGIVKVRIQWPLRRDADLERRLQAAFALPRAIVLAGRDMDEQETRSRVGELAAQYLDSVLAPDTILGVSWGRSIHELVRAFDGVARPGVIVVQMMGALGSANPAVDGTDLARRLADAIGATYRYLHAPLVVHDSALREALLHEASIGETMALAYSAQIALIGIGSLEPGQTSMLRSGYVTQAEMEQVKQDGGVGEICGRYFDIQGAVCKGPLDDCLMGIDLQALQGKELVIGVVAGEARSRAVLGALRGRFVHTLVTDERCAARVFELHHAGTA